MGAHRLDGSEVVVQGWVRMVGLEGMVSPRVWCWVSGCGGTEVSGVISKIMSEEL